MKPSKKQIAELRDRIDDLSDRLSRIASVRADRRGDELNGWSNALAWVLGEPSTVEQRLASHERWTDENLPDPIVPAEACVEGGDDD